MFSVLYINPDNHALGVQIVHSMGLICSYRLKNTFKNLLWNHKANYSGEQYRLIEPLVLLRYVNPFSIHSCQILSIFRVLTRILKTGFIESIPGKSWSQNWKIGVWPGKVGVFSFSRNMKSFIYGCYVFILQHGNFKFLVRTSCEQKRF